MNCNICKGPVYGDNFICDDCREERDSEYNEGDELTIDCQYCGWPNELYRNLCVDCKRDLNSDPTI